MKRCIVWKAIAIACVLSIFLVPCSSAHSGRTDSNGGHTDHSTGEYHYHHGFPAHQHTNGVCPYSFVDKTGSSSGSGGGKSSSSSGSSHASNSASSSSKTNILSDIIAILIYLGPLVTYIIYNVIKAIRGGIAKLTEARIEKKNYFENKDKYTLLYGGKSAEELSSIPKDAEIGSDGLPKLRGVHGWGEPFTFYRSSTGSVYHCNYACSNGAIYQIHACQVWFLRPCKRCKPTLPDLKWYQEYCKIKAIKEKYKMP